ncbi:hypothetical protein [Streptomyces physcomitrii]|uniref:Uncharacterized protein n=1 Tax=Streptomyces physcomitrii TaxID=2724184 RepID=A0ABX1H3F8_9ACTN|nr:hypothetical protein [Streptomyces physcomitrii]
MNDGGERGTASTGSRDGEESSGGSPLAVEAAGVLSEAFETTERARGHLYSFHQLTGHADLRLDDVVDLLHRCGHPDLAEEIGRELLGRNVLPGRWTFQLVEEYDDDYYATFRRLEEKVRARLTGGRRHVLEARMKEDRRTRGHSAHTSTPSGDADA